MKLKIRKFIHPDSIGQMVWVVEQQKLATGQYAKPNTLYWSTISESFTSEQEAIEFMESIKKSPEGSQRESQQ